MELVVNFALRRGPGQRAHPIADLLVLELFTKDQEEVVAEIEEDLETIVASVYRHIETFVGLGGLNK